MTPTSSRTSTGQQQQQQQQRGDSSIYVDLKSPPVSSLAPGSRAAVVRAEWFWASIQMCCRASEVLYEITSSTCSTTGGQQQQSNGEGGVGAMTGSNGIGHANPPTKRMKLSRENLLAEQNDNSPRMVTRHIDSPDVAATGCNPHPKKKSANNLIATNLGSDNHLFFPPSCSSSP